MQLEHVFFQEDNQGQRQQYRAFLRAALEALPTLERQAVILRLLKGYTLAQCAKYLKVSPSTVSRRCWAGQEKLRQWVEMVERAGLFR